MATSARVQCPICKKGNDLFAEPLGPFCSARCKMIDLGAWASDGYSIAGNGENNVGETDADNKSDASSRSH